MASKSCKLTLFVVLVSATCLPVCQALIAVERTWGVSPQLRRAAAVSSSANSINTREVDLPRQHNLALRGGGQAPDPKHVALVGTVCAVVLVLNEIDMLSVVVRVGLTFILSIVFLLAGINKTTDTFHKPTYLLYANMFPDICRRVWGPLLEQSINRVLSIASKLYPGLKKICGDNGKGRFSVATQAAASITPSKFMMAIGYTEMWSAMFMLISLAGTGSRGYRVPLAELSNIVLLILMAGAVYTHYILQDGHIIPPAILGMLLLVRLATPAPSGKKAKKGKAKADAKEKDAA
mmetsp:Transcript_10193/g.23866  ORF Transcript_10193/g.23866 Transcript_10193/m.23866 type:complete len:293 (-) Transcript_10193:164-1042(-)|eukprot:CAMPEP_0177727688 /NCGR_PEP_ID=MMETSP0484_2-20121128/20458_1 /TAXON_ID=354590 /ORGANISM="Rhodomonas lens, Strain RHODO" /LENGTH=292 /DNA_ID=CAMNT_0019240365 /DNA_START=114 /DNA_END=992 /DNA_ORIENTATION=-